MRLIDADALELFIAAVRKGLYLDHTLSDIPTRDSMLLNFQQYVHLQPTIDAVQVVRCGECRYRELAKVNCKGYTICPASGMEITDDDYCSYGERKEDRK